MNQTRADRIVEMFTKRGEDFHALFCRAPQNVLMLTGYQPILGNSFCLVTLNGNQQPEVRLAVPKDEEDLVPPGAAVEVKTFVEETMDFIGDTTNAAYVPLDELIRDAGLNEQAVVGYEGMYAPIAPAYTQVGVPGPATYQLLQRLFLADYLIDVTHVIDELASIKADEEIEAIKRAEHVAYLGFIAAREAIYEGVTEAEVAAAMYEALVDEGYAAPGARNVQPHVHVMAGPRSAQAYKAFNLTSDYALCEGDPVLVQMELAINGYWAELTRTFFVNRISDEWRRAHETCVAAQDAAFQVIRDGAAARDVDAAARSIMTQAGFGPNFKHGLGHGLGFQAINHSATPILHPVSKDILRTGMVHNVEPAVYIDGVGGIRLNDNVAVRPTSAEILSSEVLRDLNWLVVHN